jgi:serine/threonine-protein kinase RsbW
VSIRVLRPDEAARVGQAITLAYGDSYAARWVYDPKEVARRISDGALVCCIAEDEDGELLCHGALTVEHRGDHVGHAGLAVTLPAARGRGLYTAVKRHMAALARSRGLAGLYSEATAVHPYSQRANAALGAHETGFLLGWTPVSVHNDASQRAGTARRQSVALFYLTVGHAPDRPAFVPERYHEVVHRTITTCSLRARLAELPRRLHLERRATVHTHLDRERNVAVATVMHPGRDLGQRLDEERRRALADGLDGIYADLPLDEASTGVLAAEAGEDRYAYAGIFPNRRRRGDVLRLQSLARGVVDPADVTTATDYGRDLLDYVLGDLRRAGHPVAGDAVQS